VSVVDTQLPLAAATPVRDGRWLKAARRAKLLSWVSLAWMSVEGVGGVISGIGASSISLVAWGLTSAVEGAASAIVIWRFTGSRMRSPTSERTAQRLVAISLFLLGPYIVIESLRDLIGGDRAEASAFGIVLTGTAVVVMPLLGRAKRRLGRELGSIATSAEGTQNNLCALQSAAVLASMGLIAISSSLSLFDPLAALFIAFIAVKEGREAWRGEGCASCASPLASAAAAAARCEDDCC
jgi:divalent metal cation (Fe/Co/Zn/Cd) transporter